MLWTLAAPILHRLGDMGGAQALGADEVREGARHPQHAVDCRGGQRHPLEGGTRVERLLTDPGSRYRLELDTGDEIPVSRTREAEIRNRLL